MLRIDKLFLFIFVLLVPFSYAQKIDPELTLGAEQKIRAILIAEHKLSDSEFKQLNAIGIVILKNFTLEPWYEIEAPYVNLTKLEGFDFIKEIKAVREYKIANETKIAEKDNSYWLFLALIFMIVIFYFLRKQKITATIFIFFLLSSAVLADGEGKIDQRILSSDSEIVNVIVEAEEGFNFSLHTLEMREFKFGNFYYMKIPKSEISKLEKAPSVKKVRLETEYKILLDVSVPLVNTSSFLGSGYNGSGIKICILDTGVNKTHPALISRVINESDFIDEGLEDLNGHGTHVAGIAASNDSVYRGIAPAASVLSAKVCNATGSCSEPAILSGVDWCISQDANILSLSLGGPSNTDGSDALSRYVDIAVDKGKIVTVAAGNNGSNPGTIDCPGCAHKVITVGNTYKQSYSSITWGSGCIDSSPVTDQIVCSSSRGPTNDSRIKPDISAPGALINSAAKSGGGFSSKGGTSMSTPMVAGLAALALQARNITPEELKALIMNTAVELGPTGKDNSYGAGRVNGSRLFNEINNTARATIRNESRVHNIFVPAGIEIRATLYWPENYSLHNNVDLQLLDPAGNVKSLSASVNNTDERVNFSSPIAGNWKLLVSPVNVSGNQVYALASNFKPSEQMYLAVQNASSNVVYHEINVTNSSKLTINLDWNSSSINMDLYLYNTTGQFVNYSNVSGINYENVSINNPATGIWTARLVTNASASYSLSSNFSIFQQIVDNAAPSIAIIEPVNKTYAAQNINLSINITENLKIVVNCSMVIDNSLVSLGSVQGAIVTKNFSANDNAHSVYVTCTDSANNTGNSVVVNFTVDATLPSVTFVSPTDANNSFLRRNYTFINVTITDTNLDSCVVEWNSTNYTMTKSPSGCFLNKTDSEGTYTYIVRVNDSAGNVNSTQRMITFDTTLPSASASFPDGSRFSPNSDNIFDEIGFNVTASETVNFSTTYLLAANGSRVKTFNKVDNTKSILKTWNGCFIQSCSTGLAPEGNYSIEIEMTDRTGNINATNLSEKIILDTTSMIISFANPTPNNEILQNSNSITVNVTLAENGSAKLEWNGTNETMQGAATNWFKLKSNLADGNYTFRVYANDSVGNKNVSETRWAVINATRNLTSVISAINQTLSSRNITVLILNATGHSADSNRLLSFANYTLRFNISSILIETADFLVGSLNASAVLNITNNITAELNVSAAFNSSGGILDGYAWMDLNNLLPAGNFTAKIVFPRIYAIYFYLNGTKDNPSMIRAGACYANVSNVPCYNISANASTLYLPAFSGGAGGNDTKAPALGMSSPIQTTYASSSIALSYTVGDNVAVDRCWYRLNSGFNTTLGGCANTTITASEGSNTLILYTNDMSGNVNQTSVVFSYSPPDTSSSSSSSSSSSGGASRDNITNTTGKPAAQINKTGTNKTNNETQQNAIANTTNENLNKSAVKPTGLIAALPANYFIGAAVVVGTLFILIFVYRPKKQFIYNYKKKPKIKTMHKKPRKI